MWRDVMLMIESKYGEEYVIRILSRLAVLLILSVFGMWKIIEIIWWIFSS